MAKDNMIGVNELILELKAKLVEYWVNEVNLPINIQLRSMAIMDLTGDEYIERMADSKYIETKSECFRHGFAYDDKCENCVLQRMSVLNIAKNIFDE